MIRDDIFYGNILGLLKSGKWTLNASEAVALVQILQEVERRRKPPVPLPVEEPIKRVKKNGNK